MRRIWQVILCCPLAVACAHADECVSTIGVDRSPPEVVVRAMKSQQIAGYQLIDRLICKDKAFWIAIPSDIPADLPRPPGVGFMVTLEFSTEEVEISKGL